MFKKFFGLVSLVGLVGVGTLGACTVETKETTKADSGTVDAGKKETGPTTTPDSGPEAPACYDEKSAAAIPPNSISVTNTPGKCTDAELQKFATDCSTATGSDTACQAYLATTCGKCLLGGQDKTTGVVTVSALTPGDAGVYACIADKLGLKAVCASQLASEQICTGQACSDCKTNADSDACYDAAASGPCESTIVLKDSECGKAFTAAQADTAKFAAAQTACAANTGATLADFALKVGGYYCK
jgi:hypothetical protein